MFNMKVASHLMVVVLCCILSYYTSINNHFTFDDHLAIVNNNDVVPTSSLSSFRDIWSHDIWGKDIRAHDSHRSFRPLLITLFKILSILYGTSMNSAKFFRIVSILSHTVCSVSVYFLSEMMLLDHDVALGSSLLFASHPIHVEAVVAVVNIAESLSCALCIWAYLLFLSTTSNSSAAKNKPISTLVHILSVCMIIIAILFKETSITTCALIIINALLNLYSDLVHVTTVSSTSHAYVKKGLKEIFVLWSLRYGFWIVNCVLLSCCFVILRIFLVSGDFNQTVEALVTGKVALQDIVKKCYLNDSQLIRRAENPFAFLNGEKKLLSLIYLHFRYLYLLLVPLEQCAEYAFNCIPMVNSVTDHRFFAAAVMYIVLSITAIVLLISLASKKYFKISLALLLSFSWLVIPFLPASGIAVLGTLLAERLLYVPSVGFCLLLSRLTMFACSYPAALSECSRISKNLLSENSNGYSTLKNGSMKNSHLLFYTIIMLLTSLYSYRTRSYSRAWQNDEMLFNHAYQVCPSSAKLNLQLSKLAMQRQDFVAAEMHVQQAKLIDPDFCDVGYEEALLQVFHHRNVDKAVELCLINLNCIYSNIKSLQLLNKLYEQQMAMTINGSTDEYRLLEQHGDSFLNLSLYGLAVQKYTSAALSAFRLADYSNALSFSAKAEQAVETYIADPAVVEVQATRLYCDVYTLSARIKIFLTSRLNDNAKLSKKTLKDVKRNIVNVLLSSLQPHCLYNVVGGSISYFNYDAIAHIGHLSGLLAKRYDQIDAAVAGKADKMASAYAINIMTQYAKLQDIIVDVLSVYRKLRSDDKVSKDNISAQHWDEYADKINNFKVSSSYLWETLARRLIAQGANYDQALLSLQSAVQYPENTACSTYYYIALSLSNTAGFYDDKVAISKVIEALNIVLHCGGNGIFDYQFKNVSNADNRLYQQNILTKAKTLYTKLTQLDSIDVKGEQGDRGAIAP